MIVKVHCTRKFRIKKKFRGAQKNSFLNKEGKLSEENDVFGKVNDFLEGFDFYTVQREARSELLYIDL